MLSRRSFFLTSATLLSALGLSAPVQAKDYGKTTAASGACLFIANDYDPNRIEEYERWYNTQHLDERLGIPGFLSARRYIAVPGQADRKYMAIYETESSDTLKSHQYMKRLNDPTQLTKSIMPGFQRMNRSLVDVKWADGAGMGPIADVIVIYPEKDTIQKLKELAPKLWQKEPAFEKARFMQNAFTKDQQTVSEETKMRGGPDEEYDGVLVLEWADLEKFPAPKLTEELKKAGIKINEKAGGRYRLINAR